MSETESKFEIIPSLADLPAGPSSVVNCFCKTKIEAKNLAAATRRHIYWVEDQGIAVWYQPYYMRRESDLAPQVMVVI